MKRNARVSRWKSAASEARFRTLEDRFWRQEWKALPESLDVETHLGRTRAYAARGCGVPVVFLHGIGGTSIMWSGYFDALAGRSAYAIDTMGDLGRSEPRVPIEDAADLVQWLDETIDGLGVERAHFVGTSYGAFLALNLAARVPERVQSLTLLEPAGIVRVQLGRFLMWGVAIGCSSFLPARARVAAARKLRMPLVNDVDMIRMVRLGQSRHATRLVRPHPLSDDELRAITAPTLLMLGSRSEAFPPVTVQERARDLLRDVDVVTVEDAGHALVWSHTNVVLSRLRAFLERQDANA